MKKIILYIILFIVLPMLVTAQPVERLDVNKQIYNPGLAKFVGTWQWVSGIDTIKIVLKKEHISMENVILNCNCGDDAIIGFHMYKKGNAIVESSIQYANTSYTAKKSTIIGRTSNVEDIKLNAWLTDITKNKSVVLKLTLNTDRTILTWHTDVIEGVKIGPYNPGFTLPRDIILTKQ